MIGDSCSYIPLPYIINNYESLRTLPSSPPDFFIIILSINIQNMELIERFLNYTKHDTKSSEE